MHARSWHEHTRQPQAATPVRANESPGQTAAARKKHTAGGPLPPRKTAPRKKQADPLPRQRLTIFYSQDPTYTGRPNMDQQLALPTGPKRATRPRVEVSMSRPLSWARP